MSDFSTAYEKLKSLVMENLFHPGEHLHVVNLADHLAVGITPVREALIRLSAEELIACYPKRGFFARVITAKELGELYRLACSLLTSTLRNADDRATIKVVAVDVDYVLNRTQADRHLSLAMLVEQLHEQIAELIGNQEVAKVIRRYNQRTHSIRRIYLEQGTDPKQAISYLRDLAALIERNDRENAIAKITQLFDAKLVQIPRLAKEVTARAFSTHWTERFLETPKRQNGSLSPIGGDVGRRPSQLKKTVMIGGGR